MVTKRSAFVEVIESILSIGAKKATKYVAENHTVKATFQGKRSRLGKEGSSSILVTFGRPNYLERKFIKKCKKAGEPFPVKKVQLVFPKSTARPKSAAKIPPKKIQR